MEQGLLSNHVAFSTRAKVVIGLLICCTTVAAGVSVGSLVETVLVKKQVDKIPTSDPPTPLPVPTSAEPLPVSYAVPLAYQLPATDQDGLGTCWAWATMYVLEAQYRAQGIALGYLEEDEWVKFSTQAYFSFLGKECAKNPVPACHYGGLMHGSSEDQEIESIYYFAKAWNGALGKAILPDAVCPYNYYEGQPDFDYFNCTGLDDALKANQNPISWKVKSITMAYETTKIKELLFSKKRALGIGTPLSDLVYYPSCQDEPWASTDSCKIWADTPCPDGPGTCYKLTIDGRHQDGVFLGEADTRKMAELGGHAMNIVGYNDDWVFHERFQAPIGTDAPPQLKGGFILHNSWTADRGHSVQYLQGNQSQENEDYLCPNQVSPDTWIPASRECVAYGVDGLKATASTKPVLNCSGMTAPSESLIQRVRGGGIAKTADVLYCKDASFCDKGPDVFYFLAKASPTSSDADVKYLSSGLHQIKVIKANITDGTTGEATINRLPFWALSRIFSPVPSTVVHNNVDLCGYWMLPYQTLENLKRLNWDLLDNFRVIDFEVEFDEQSYAKSEAAKAFNTSLLLQSTHKFVIPPLDGPIPFAQIYPPQGL